jgi:cytochrome P450
VVYTVAGADTTGATVESAILYMVLYPEAKKKAQAEVDAVIGKNRLPVLGDRPELPYVTAFLMVQCSDTVHHQYNSTRLQEVMRCFSPLPYGG